MHKLTVCATENPNAQTDSLCYKEPTFIMPEKFLYDLILEEFGKRTIQNTEIPTYLTDNLNSAFELREYQKEAFARFLLCFENDFPRRRKTTAFSIQHGNRQRQNAHHGRLNPLPLRTRLSQLSLFRQLHQHHRKNKGQLPQPARRKISF